jgi:hypothetical protein
MAPYEITVYPKRSEYLSALYAGLFELNAAGEVVLEFSRQLPSPAYDRVPMLLRIEVSAAGRRIEICFDTADWRTIVSPDDLRTADLYFKRSYHAPSIAELEPALQSKVAPMGLQYACTSRRESLPQSVREVVAQEIACGNVTSAPLKTLKRIAACPIKRTLEAIYALPRLHRPMYIDEYEVNPDVPAEPKIYYRTRVYGPDDAPQNFRLGRMNEVNDLRANTVRALRAHFGERFIGGLRHSEYARRTYPDCLFRGDPGWQGHVALTKNCLIVVNTAGLHDSTSWKMAEYMAGSRCIVSERPFYETTAPLVEGKHYFPLSTPEDCVAACERLLDEPDTARSMRNASFAYYSAHVRPDQLVKDCIRTALTRCVRGASDGPALHEALFSGAARSP